MRRAHRRALPSRVAIEAQQWRRDHRPQLFDLRLGKRCSKRRDSFSETGLGERDHIHIALDHDDTPGLACGGCRLVEIVERSALVEERRLGGVQIFWFAAVQNAPTKGDHPAALVCNGDHDPAPEPVVAFAALVLRGDQHAGFDQHGLGEVAQRRL